MSNARVNYRANGSSVTYLEDMHYYPFGMLLEGLGATASPGNKYRYNGKEMNDDLGLNWYDYGARWYDAAVGRWWSVDPLAAETADQGSYNYVLNNPLILIDPTGMLPVGRGEDTEAFRTMKADEANRRAAQLTLQHVVKVASEFLDKKQSSSQNTPSVSLTVTNEVIGTANLISGPAFLGNGPLDYYYEVNTYRMQAQFEDSDGNVTIADYEVIRYGIKMRDGAPPYYQGVFAGNPGYQDNDVSYTIETFDDGYTRGGFDIIGQYDLHGGPSNPTALPNQVGGRVNYGCIAVCGLGWQELKREIARVGGVENYDNNRPGMLRPVAERGIINVTIQPLVLPAGTPNAIDNPNH